MNKFFSFSVVVACISLLPQREVFADDGAGGLAAILFFGFILAIVLLVSAVRLVSKNDQANYRTNTLLFHCLKLGAPAIVFYLVNAIMVYGYIGLEGFVNPISILFTSSLILTYFVFSIFYNDKKFIFIARYNWLCVAILIMYALLGYIFLGW